VNSLDVLEGMHKLEKVIINNKVSEKSVKKFKEAHAGCEVIFFKN
jgi:3-deoxy-D-manno-octulosonic-acid transferase